MDTIQSKGVTYTKASVLAKRHRYTTDYIGQLCRAHKVDALLVGRAWYVHENSLLTHKIVKSKDTRQDVILSKNAIEINTVDESEKVHIRPLLSKKTHRQFFSAEIHPVISKHWEYRAVAYVDDEATLVPQVTNKIVTTLVEAKPDEKIVDLPITLVNPEKILVKDVSQHNYREHLSFTELPAVSLSGRITIADLDAVRNDVEPNPVTSQDLPHQELFPVTKEVKISSSIKPVRSVPQNVTPRIRPILPVMPTKGLASVKVSNESERTLATPLVKTFSPTVGAATPQAKASSRKLSLLVPVVIVLTMVLTGISLAFSSTVVFGDSSTRQSISFDHSFFGEALVYLSL